MFALCSLSAEILSDVNLHVREPYDGFREVGQLGVQANDRLNTGTCSYLSPHLKTIADITPVEHYNVTSTINHETKGRR